MAEAGTDSPLEKIRATKLNTYANNPQRITQDFKLEAADSADYSRRFIFEFLQNADDEMPSDPSEGRCVRFELHEDRLLVANTGRPFDTGDLEALTTLTQTTKGNDDEEATIGHKGRGFTSVLDVTNNPAAFSKSDSETLAAQFDRERTRTAIERRLDAEGINSEEYTANVPLMPLPFPTEVSDRIQHLFEEEFTTVFRLPLSPETRERIHDTIASTLIRNVTRETVALLPNTDSIELVVGSQKRTWELSRRKWEGSVDATVIQIECHGDLHNATRPEKSEKIVSFEREYPIPDHSFVGIEQAILDDIGNLRTSVAFGLDEDDGDETRLQPLHIGEDQDQRPFVHVFLPTEERSPIPALLNGTFQVSTARRSLNMPTDPETKEVVGLNGWLFTKAAETIANDVLNFVRETDTSIAEFLHAIDFTDVLEDETARQNPVNQCFVEAIRDAFTDIPFVPRLEVLASGERGFEPDPQPLDDIVIPYTHTAKERLGKLTAMVYGRGRFQSSPNGDRDVRGWFPATTLLDDSVASILVELGAAGLKPWETPHILGSAPDENAVLQYTDEDDRLTIDPIVYTIAETWQTLTEDEQKNRLAESARTEPVFPVGRKQEGSAGPYYKHETTPDDIETFFPPRQEVPTDALSGVRLFPYALYYTGGSRQEDAQAREAVLDGGDFKSILQSIWQINDFAFQDIAEKGIYPLLPGPSSPEADDTSLRDVSVIEFIQRLACSSTSGQRAASPNEPLPYEYRDAEPYYDLCMLPLPTADGEWTRAHELYFGAAWQRDKPRPARIEQLLADAGIDAPILAPPEHFGITKADTLSDWQEFFQWLGVAEHIRITPLFHPSRWHRYKKTEYVQAAEGSILNAECPFSPDELTENDLEIYLEDLKSRANDAADEDNDERPFIWQVNGLEFDAEILTAATDPEYGEQLLWHLYDWWDDLSKHADARVALYNNNRLRYQPNYLFTEDEKEPVKANLWLWQIRRAAWLPTVLGIVPPQEAWHLSDTDLQRYSLDIEDKRHPLLPTLPIDSFDETAEKSSEFLSALSVRRRVEADSLTPTDVERFADRIYHVATEAASEHNELEFYLSEIEAAYGYLGEKLPPLDNQGNIQYEEWQPENTGIDSVLVPCFDGEELTFCEASDVYFTRSHEEAERFTALDVPVFALTREDAPRIGMHLGMTDLVKAVKETPRPDEERREETSRFRNEWFEPAAAYILCRLKATRSSQEVLQRDADGLSNFINSVLLVSDLFIEFNLHTEGDTESLRRPAEYFIERDESGDRSTVYISTESDDVVVNPPTQTIAKAFADFRGLGSWEPIYVLLQHAPDPTSMKEQLQAAGAPASERELVDRQSAFEGDDKEPEDVETVRGATSIEREAREQTERTHSNESSDDTAASNESNQTTTTRDGSRVPDPEQFAGIGEREVVATVDPRSGGSTHEREDKGDNSPGASSSGGGSTSRQTTVTANYIDKVDEFGMEATYNAELDRLREDGCENPEAYVHDIHTRDLYTEARDNHEIARPVLEKLEERGIISKPYPGFDFIVISRDEEWPERCIELKSSGSDTRRPSISWNEWKSARNEDLRETYYLYVATCLEAGQSGDAELVQIPDPFNTLDSREQTVRTQSREVQVKLSRFYPENDDVVKRPIHWDE